MFGFLLNFSDFFGILLQFVGFAIFLFFLGTSPIGPEDEPDRPPLSQNNSGEFLGSAHAHAPRPPGLSEGMLRNFTQVLNLYTQVRKFFKT